MSENVALREKLRAIKRVAEFRPGLTVGVVALSCLAAIFEGIGLSFLVPIIESVQSSSQQPTGSGILRLFTDFYELVGIPFTLEYIIAGVGVVMFVRYAATFLSDYLKVALRISYLRYLKQTAFENALTAEVSYFDTQGSDEILNSIVTESKEAAKVIQILVNIVQTAFLSAMYMGIALYMAPYVTILAGVFIGAAFYVVRSRFVSGFSVGDQVAQSNEDIQTTAQAGMQGIHEVKSFNLQDEMAEEFDKSVRWFEKSMIQLRRNREAMRNAFRLIIALSVFGLMYVVLEFTALSLSGLGVFLFAIFRLSPKASNLNDFIYSLDGQIAHLVRTQKFLDQLADTQESASGRPIPAGGISTIAFDDVRFGYTPTEQVLSGVSFIVDSEAFVAFVGPSGAGKSTIVSLLSRYYAPDAGEITADGVPISEFDLNEWRDRVTIVRQQPHLFNETLWENVTVGDRDATEPEVKDALEIAKIDEFFDELPDGYETVLGDDGVRLSGGQRQRVAIARALLKDADLLVLDEATSDLDTNLEEEVHAGIESMNRDFAILVVAHRLSTVTNADTIYVMEDGEIRESGIHEELVAMEGEYSSLYDKQVM